MWADCGVSSRHNWLAQRDPFRWSKPKSCKETIAELKGYTMEKRPVCMEIKSKDGEKSIATHGSVPSAIIMGLQMLDCEENKNTEYWNAYEKKLMEMQEDDLKIFQANAEAHFYTSKVMDLCDEATTIDGENGEVRKFQEFVVVQLGLPLPEDFVYES